MPQIKRNFQLHGGCQPVNFLSPKNHMKIYSKNSTRMGFLCALLNRYIVQECLFKLQFNFQESEVVPEEVDMTAAHLQGLTENLIEEFACFFRNTPSLRVSFFPDRVIRIKTLGSIEFFLNGVAFCRFYRFCKI